MGPTQTPIQRIPGLFPQQTRESDHTFPSNTEVKNGGTIPPLSHTLSRRDS
jgi:hypothetical protein